VVAVITDSASNVPPEVAADLGIVVVPLHVHLGDDSFRDGVDLAGPEFYDRVAGGERASTSAPSPGDYLEAFRSVGDPEVVCVTLASGLSAAHQEAVIAAREFNGRVEVVDSASATWGEGFVTLEAARAARAIRPIQEVVARARNVAAAVRVLGAIETFEYLKRSGRVGALQAYAATMLNIRPVFRLQAGEILPSGRPRTRRRALTMIVEETLREVGDRAVHLAAFHARAEEDAREILERIARRARVVERFLSHSTAAIGAHTGPGLVGVAFFCD
jgi:DegV family protein with EDD domain